jgi:hypothetical protein
LLSRWLVGGATLVAIGLFAALYFTGGRVLPLKEPIAEPSNGCEVEYLAWLQVPERSGGADRNRPERLLGFFDACSFADLQRAGEKYLVMKCYPSEFGECRPAGYEPLWEWDASFVQQFCAQSPSELGDTRLCTEAGNG